MRRLFWFVTLVLLLQLVKGVSCFGIIPPEVVTNHYSKKCDNRGEEHVCTYRYLYSSPLLTKNSSRKYKESSLWSLKSSLTQEIVQSEFSTLGNGQTGLVAPMSLDPLMFTSTTPLLSDSQCQKLSQWCRQVIQNNGSLTKEILIKDLNEGREGAQIMEYLQKKIHEDLLGLSTSCDQNVQDDYVIPRFISYDDKDQNDIINSNEKINVSSLLPDGLHVDTNNSKHFRHFTILFYLNSCTKLGATTFPLAMPLVCNDEITESMLIAKPSFSYNDTQEAARQLIMQDVQHTRMVDASEESLELGRLIEDASLKLLADRHSGMGIRVMPEQGHVCLFSNLDEDGYPNPLSFHGGEAMYAGETKEVLTFFYEIDPTEFSNRKEFGQLAKEREMNLIKYHFSI